jgi:magnesium transporter
MLYLTRMIGKPVTDASGEVIGHISDLAIAPGDLFPRVTSLAFIGPDKTPLMLSWRKFVRSVDEDSIALNADRAALRFSYLQPDEVLLASDLLHKQIVDTQGAKLVRVNDLKLSESKNQLRLLGADVGAWGLLRAFSPSFEGFVEAATKRLGGTVRENLIAWNYIDLIDRDLSHIALSVTHKRLHELHPADVADLIEQLSAVQRAKVFEHLDNARAAEALSELEDEMQPEVFGSFSDERATGVLREMDPDDAADLIADLEPEKAEALLRLMGVRESSEIRKLMGYHEKTAGGIMTPEVTTVSQDLTVAEVIEHLRGAAAEHESIYYIYVTTPRRVLEGVISLRDLIVSAPETKVSEIVEREVITVDVDDDQEIVAETMSKYDLLALPVVDADNHLLGIVTVDDALEIMEEESAEDLAIVTGTSAAAHPFDVKSWFSTSTAWLTVWTVFGLFLAFVMDGMSHGFALFLPVVLFLPLMMRMGEDISGHAVRVLLDEGPDEARPGFVVKLFADAAAGIVLAAVTALISLLVMQLLHLEPRASYAVGLAAAATVVIMTVVTSLFPWLVLKRDGTWRMSSAVITALSGALAVAVYLMLAVAVRPVFGL